MNTYDVYLTFLADDDETAERVTSMIRNLIDRSPHIARETADTHIDVDGPVPQEDG
jgi:hypothetical protein